MENDKLFYLLEQLASNKISMEELYELKKELAIRGAEEPTRQWLLENISFSDNIAPYNKDRLSAILKSIESLPPQPIEAKAIHRLKWWLLAAAASIILIISLTIFADLNLNKKNQVIETVKADVLPGHQGAVLHLSSGREVALDSLKNGNVIMDGNIKIIKEGDSLKYVGSSSAVVYNTITTDKAREWHLTLPDGSNVWLNAESSIKYPLVFSGKERIVRMTGEAYFQVKHNEAKPFVVKVSNQIIEDLGTEFNVNAYLNESSVKATLIKGIIKVNEKVLRPGQQALIENGKMAINDVNAEQAIAWKNGIFSFENTDLKEVMKQLARWYNIDIQYEGNIPSMVFGGKITRNTNLSQVLAILQASDIHFKIQNKTLIVMP